MFFTCKSFNWISMDILRLSLLSTSVNPSYTKCKFLIRKCDAVVNKVLVMFQYTILIVLV